MSARVPAGWSLLHETSMPEIGKGAPTSSLCNNSGNCNDRNCKYFTDVEESVVGGVLSFLFHVFFN